MAGDNELRVRITADTTGLSAGLVDAQQQVESAATGMASAQDLAAAAAKRLADAQSQLGVAAAQGNAQAQQIIAAYRAEAEAAAAAAVQTNKVAEATARAATAAPALRGSMKQAAEATEEASKATTHVTGSMYAAQGAAALLEGRVPIRAMERFLTSVGPVQSALQVAFPVIGAIAIGEVLIDLIKNVTKFAEDAEDLAQELNTGWLDGAFAQLTGVGEKVKQLDQEILQFQKDARQSGQQTAEIGFQITGQKFGAAEEASQRALAAQSEATALKGSLSLLEERLRLEKEVASYQAFSAFGLAKFGQQAELATRAKAAAVTTNPNLAVKEAEDTQALIDKNIARINELEAKASELALQAGKEGTPKEKAPKEKAPKEDQLPNEIARAQIEAAHAMDAELPPAQKITAELEKQLALNLQAERASKEGTAAENDRLRQLRDAEAIGKANSQADQLAIDTLNKTFEESAKAQIEAAKAVGEAEKKAAEDYKKAYEERIQLAKQVAEDEIAAANELYEFTERDIRAQEELGKISAAVAEQMLLAALKLKEQTTQGALGKEQGLFDPNLGQKELLEFTGLENKMTQEARKAALERQKIENDEAIRIAEIWKRALTKISTEFNQDVAQWIVLHKNLAQSLSQIVAGISENFIKSLLKMTEQEIVAAATHKALLKQGIIGDAHGAAAGAYKAVSDIPVIGPALAPIAAAAAFAGTIAFESFEAGGIVNGAFGSPVPIMAHAGERILSAGQTHNFESLVNNGGPRSATLNQENHFGGGVTADMLEDHTNRTMAALKGMIRPEALA